MEGDHQYRGLRTPPADRIAALGASLGTPGTLFLRMRLMPRPVASHWLLAMLVTSALIGAVCAKLNTSGNLEVGLATTHVMIDYPDASIIDRQALPQDLATLQKRAELYGRLTTTTPVLAAISRRAGLPVDEISGISDVTADVPIQLTEPSSEEEVSRIRASKAPYRLELQADTYLPILSIYAEGPSPASAEQLANAVVPGLRDYLASVASQEGQNRRELPVLRQLGDAHGDGASSTNGRSAIAALTFVTAFALSLVSMLSLRYWRRRGTSDPFVRPSRRVPRLTPGAAADWPRTTRVLPWSVAALITMIWLTPFDRIQLAVHAPINITLDRIVLPCVAALWLIAFTAGPGAAPRIRITRVHLAVGAFLALGFLSAVLDAHYLNHTLAFTLAVKQLALLVSYIAIFLIVSSSVRRTEVPAFLTYTLVLSVIAALGAIYEYRFHQNLFTSLATTLFKGPFNVVAPPPNVSLLDSLGRRWVSGPATYGVELVMILSIALPIAVLGCLRAKTRGRKMLYGLAIALLAAAMFATARKSTLVAPTAVILTLAYFRRRDLISLAPLAVVVVFLTALLSPGAIHGVVSQFTRPDASHVATVDARTASYDAIRPELWSHLLFGQGYGSYAPPTYRIIDSEILLRLTETGVLGLLAFLLIPLSLISLARKRAYRRELRSSSIALCGVAAAVCFIVSATLYSSMSFPHGPDVFLYVAGLVVVALSDDLVADAPRAEGKPALRHVIGSGGRNGPVGKPAIPAG